MIEYQNIIPQEIWKRGVLLDSLGINELVWDFESVMMIIDILQKYEYAILGGDVYKTCNGKFFITCDSWYFKKSDNELSTSFEQAKNYILKYYESNGNGFVYSLVVERLNVVEALY